MSPNELPPLPPLESNPDSDMAALFDRVAAETVDAEPTLRDRLRSLSTPMRVALGLLVAGVLSGALLGGGGVAGMGGLRADFGQLNLLQLAIPLCLMGVGSAGAMALALRGPARPPLRYGAALMALCLGFPFVLAAVPGLFEGADTQGALKPMIGCLMMGAGVGVATSLGVVAFSRWARPGNTQLALAGAAGGLAAFVYQQLHCAAGDPLHLLGSHAALGLILAGTLVCAGAIHRAVTRG